MALNLDEKLMIAWRRIKVDQKSDFIVGDDFEYAVFDAYRDEFLERLAQRIEAEGSEYRAQPLRSIRVPKPSHTTRPGAVPVMDDRIYYQFLVDDLAEEVESKLVPVADKVVHSYRYAGNRKDEKMFRFDTASNKTFEQRIVEIAAEYKYVVKTDVSAYFERIYHHNLENTLRGFGTTSGTVDSVMALLRKWNKGNSYGIPQGLWPSDYLGNVYLDPVDKYMLRSGFSFCRYVDDMCLGAHSYTDAERSLLVLEERLATLGLNLNAGKTRIVRSEDVEEVLFPYKRRLDEITGELLNELPSFSFYAEPDPEELAILEESVSVASIRQLFEEQLASDQPDPGVSRFCLKQLRLLSDTEMLDGVLDNLHKLVVVMPQVVLYLSNAAAKVTDPSRITERVAAAVQEGSTCYDWEVTWLLNCLYRIGGLEAGAVANIRNLLLKGDRLHPAVVINAILLVGRHGDNADREWLLDNYDKHDSHWLKRAILYALQDLPLTGRNHFYGYCRGQDPLTDRLLDYVMVRKNK